MRRIGLAVFALVGTLLPARGEAAAEAPRFLTVFKDGIDRTVVETYDFLTGERHISVATKAAASHADDAGVAGVNCGNGGNWTYIPWGGGNRVRRPWRAAEEIRINPAGAPVGVNWRAEVHEGRRVWEEARNACGIADSIGFRFNAGPDTSTPATWPGSCPSPNGENVMGWTSLPGYVGYACVWSTGSWIFEGDMFLSNASGIVWCDGGGVPCTSGRLDVRSVASHEWGHFMGLGHTCGDSDLSPCDTSGETQAVMYPFIDGTQNHTLSLGDVNGAASLYPASYSFTVESVTVTNPVGGPLIPGETYTVRVELKNTGFEGWPVSDATRLLTTPAGRCSLFVSPDWRDCTDATRLILDVTNDVDSRIPNDGSVVVTGEVARFQTTFAIPFAAEGLSIVESFVPAVNGIRAAGSAGVPLTMGTYDAEVVSVSGPDLTVLEDTVLRGAQSQVVVEVRNTGTAPWRMGGDLVQLGTSAPRDRCSAYQAIDWISCERPTNIDEVTNPDDVYVRGGESARLRFLMTAPLLGPPGIAPVTEMFEMVAGNQRWFGDPIEIEFTSI